MAAVYNNPQTLQVPCKMPEVIFTVESVLGSTLGVGNQYGDWFDFSNAGNSVQEILSCVACLLNTPIGSVIGNRQIGVDYSFVDKPMTVAIPMILAAIPKAIARWEPRCTVKDVSFSSNVEDMVSLGKLQCNVVISIP